MRKRIFVALIICSSWIGFGQETDIDKTDLYGHWVHAIEEDKFYPGINVYRPSGFRTFPAKRFRASFGLDNNNQAWYLGPAQNCGVKSYPATWNFETNTHLLSIYHEKNHLIKQYVVVKKALHELHLMQVDTNMNVKIN